MRIRSLRQMLTTSALAILLKSSHVLTSLLQPQDKCVRPAPWTCSLPSSFQHIPDAPAAPKEEGLALDLMMEVGGRPEGPFPGPQGPGQNRGGGSHAPGVVKAASGPGASSLLFLIRDSTPRLAGCGFQGQECLCGARRDANVRGSRGLSIADFRRMVSSSPRRTCRN